MTVYGDIHTVVTIEYAENILKFIAKEIFYAIQRSHSQSLIFVLYVLEYSVSNIISFVR
jgi:hypothetical protein